MKFSKTVFILSAFLTAGAVAGSLCAAFVSGADALSDMLTSEVSGNIPFFTSFLVNVSVCAVVFISGFSILGIGVIPLCAAFKGFTLSYSVTSIIRVFGLKGLPFALVSPGLPGLLLVPCVIVVSAFSIRASFALTRKTKPETKAQLSAFALCVAVSAASAALNTLLRPLIHNLIQ